MMTKNEIVDWIAERSGNGAAAAARAVNALDVCTTAERKLVEAVLDVPWGAPSTRQQELNYRAAYESCYAERTPPDPVAAFIAEVKAACYGPKPGGVDRIDMVARALQKLSSSTPLEAP